MPNTLSALTINDESTETITYNKSSLDNNYIKPISLDALFEVFQENPEQIFTKYKYTDLTIILDDYTEIQLSEYQSDKKPIFIKMTSDELKKSHNEIIIGLQNTYNISSDFLQWQSAEDDWTEHPDVYILNDPQMSLTKLLDYAITDYNGYENSIKMQNIAKNTLNKDPETYLPAISYCMSIKYGSYQGYLPSMGQLAFVRKYADILNYISQKFYLHYIYGIPLDFTGNTFWSSTLAISYLSVYAMRLSSGLMAAPSDRLSKYKCIPFFKDLSTNE